MNIRNLLIVSAVAGIGLYDDWQKISKKGSEGLSVRYKFLLLTLAVLSGGHSAAAQSATPSDTAALLMTRAKAAMDAKQIDVALKLALDALEGVVDRLHVAAQLLADLLVALALDVEPEHVDLEAGEERAGGALRRARNPFPQDSVGPIRA